MWRAVQVALGGDLARVVPTDAMQVDDQWRCDVAPLGEMAAAGARYMDDTLTAKAVEMERRVDAFAAAVSAQYGVTDFHPAHAAAQEKVREDRKRALLGGKARRQSLIARLLVIWSVSPKCIDPDLLPVTKVVVVGRVVGDGDARLSVKSVLLEGSVAHCGGTRVRLELREAAAAAALFPGQVVAAEGFNPSGHCLVVSRLFTSAAPPLAPPPAAQRGDGSLSGASTPPCERAGARCDARDHWPFFETPSYAPEARV